MGASRPSNNSISTPNITSSARSAGNHTFDWKQAFPGMLKNVWQSAEEWLNATAALSRASNSEEADEALQPARQIHVTASSQHTAFLTEQDIFIWFLSTWCGRIVFILYHHIGTYQGKNMLKHERFRPPAGACMCPVPFLSSQEGLHGPEKRHPRVRRDSMVQTGCAFAMPHRQYTSHPVPVKC